MKSKTITVSSCRTGDQTRKSHRPNSRQAQCGVTLIELMVGLAIGLLVVAVAMGGLMVSRSVSGTVSDASTIQQQAAYAMRVIGLQLRQAGSLRLNPNASGASEISEQMAPVAFEVKKDDFDLTTEEGKKLILQGSDNPGSGEYKLTIGYAGYTEASHVTDAISFRDCLGQTPKSTLLQSRFVLDNSKQELKCAGASGAAQAIINNVADFQVRYLQQTQTGSGNPTLQYVNAATVGSNWAQVQGVEVCLTLFGAESIDMPTDGSSTYTRCDGQRQDMAALTDSQRKGRLHITFRNVFQLRSQGLIGTVL